MIAARLKIRTDAVTQILCLSNIDDLAGLVPMYVNTGVGWQRF